MDISPQQTKACECDEVDLTFVACYSPTTRLNYDVFFPANVLALTAHSNFALAFRNGGRAKLYSLIA
jgi:hypothetical protein